jgi:nucleotide-binding universal stress UspA family protein
MFSNIAVPFDMAHVEKQAKAISTAADLARHYGASLTLVGVTSNTPSQSAHSPDEFSAQLADYAQRQSSQYGIPIKAHSAVGVDIAVELEKLLDQAIHEIGADLVIMASHQPGFRDYLIRSHSSKLAAHSDLSVMIVR